MLFYRVARKTKASDVEASMLKSESCFNMPCPWASVRYGKKSGTQCGRAFALCYRTIQAACKPCLLKGHKLSITPLNTI